MPVPNEGESEQDFVSRCIPILKKEGKDQKQAEGECYGIFREHHKKASAVLRWVHSHCWAITPEALEQIISIAGRDFSDMQAVATKRAEYATGSAFTGVRDGVAVIDVIGPIFTRASFFQAISGATDTERLATDIGAAMADKSVHSILLNVDSPGGEISGISELAAIIRQANAVKPVTAFIQGAGASAAYWLASAAGQVNVADTALVGSIGVYWAMESKDPKPGTKTYEFISSQSPHKRPNLETEAGKAKYQALVDTMGAVFQDSVAKYRATSTKKVQEDFGQGGMFVGQEAVDRGMADKVSTFEETFKSLLKASQKNIGGITMNAEELKQKFPEVYASIYSAGENSGKTSAAAKVDEDKGAALKSERERIQAIESIKAPGYEHIIAAEKYKPEMTKDKVSAIILAAQEEKAKTIAAARNADASGIAAATQGTNSPVAPEDAQLASLISVAAKAASGKPL